MPPRSQADIPANVQHIDLEAARRGLEALRRENAPTAPPDSPVHRARPSRRPHASHARGGSAGPAAALVLVLGGLWLASKARRR